MFKAKQIKPSQDQRSAERQGFSLKTKESVLNRFKTRNIRLDVVASLMLFTLLTILGCASIQRPTGGPKDIEPPKVLETTPKNLSTQFTAKKITINFDEYIKLQNEFREITYAPEIENIPEIKNIGKGVEITFKEPLLPNTTYTINFGEAIADVNENNKLKNFSYVFSTGTVLDSLSIEGNIKSAFTLLPEKEILVFAIPKSADSTFGKKKPIIFTKTDTAGNYSLKNLRADTYKVYALNDKNADRLYQAGLESIGFYDEDIVLNENKKAIDISIFNEKPLLFRNLDRKINPDGTVFLTFNRPINAPSIKIVEPATLNNEKITTFAKTLDTVKIWVPNHNFDSLKVEINEQDTLLQTIMLTKAKNEKYNSTLLPQYNLEDDNKINPYKPLELRFNTPILSVDKSKITLKEDSVNRSNFEIKLDLNQPELVTIIYPWKDTKYELNIAEGAIKSLYNYTNKAILKRMEKANQKDYGRLDITYKLTDTIKRGYLVEFLNSSAQVLNSTYITQDTTIVYQNYRVGKHFIRVVYDANNNKKWDGGDLATRTQSEKIWYDPRPFTIRSNWEVKEIIEIPSN